MLSIKSYQENEQLGINSLIMEIAEEFEEPIITSNSTSKKKFDHLWLVKKNDLLVGTIGVILIKNRNAILKSMFVKKEFRGKETGVSSLLMKTAMDWLKNEKIDRVYLGTMKQFRAAQKFYTKHGFQKIDEAELPSDFIDNPLDSLYFRMNLIYD